MLPTALISAASTPVGELTVDPADIRGEGGAARPVLVVPVLLRLKARPKDQQVVVLSLEADLVSSSQPGSGRIGTDVRDLRSGLHVVSVDGGTPPHRVEFRFPVTLALIEQLERDRHQREGTLSLSLSCRAVLGWVRAYNQIGQVGTASVPFDLGFGMLADITLFWSPSVDDLSFSVEQNTWIARVLPALGYDRLRLVEVRLPPELGDERIRKSFGRQLQHLDRRGYRESVTASRDLLHAWEKRLDATRARPVAAVVGDLEGWPTDDPRRKFLDQLWTAAKDLANTAHHEANQSEELDLDEAETRTHMLLTAALSEWLTTVIDPGSSA